MVSSAGSVLDHVVYDSFGNITTETNASNGDRFKFAGMEYDATTGQYYDHARWYGATAGRFLCTDPGGLSAGDGNLLRYVHNSPTNYDDPTGELQVPTGPGGPSGVSNAGSTSPSQMVPATPSTPPTNTQRGLSNTEQRFLTYMFNAALPKIKNTPYAKNALAGALVNVKLVAAESIPLLTLDPGDYIARSFLYFNTNVKAVTPGGFYQYYRNLPYTDSPDIRNLALIGHETMHTFHAQMLGTPVFLLWYLQDAYFQAIINGGDPTHKITTEMQAYAMQSVILQFPEVWQAFLNGTENSLPADLPIKINGHFQTELAIQPMK